MELDKNVTILVADDEELMRILMVDVLTRFGFTNILQAANGDEALALARQHRPRFALLDVYMPGTDGWDVVKCLTKELPGTILIMVTGSNSMVDLDEYVSLGADGYFFKPFDSALLLETMTKLNESHPPA